MTDRQRAALIVAGILALTAGGTAAAVVYGRTRGLRNNNPGNIRKSGTVWQGMAPTQPDPAFVSFVAPEYGIRALGKVLLSYRAQGRTSVRDTITRWAPPSENNTAAYIAAVARELHVDPTAPLPASALPDLVTAIIRHENSTQPYPPQLIADGLALI